MNPVTRGTTDHAVDGADIAVSRIDNCRLVFGRISRSDRIVVDSDADRVSQQSIGVVYVPRFMTIGTKLILILCDFQQ